MTRLALVNTATGAVVSFHQAGRGRVTVPGEAVTVSPPVSGWEHGDYALLSVVPHDPPPEGQQVAGITHTIAGGQVVEVATYEPIPPDPAPTEVSRRQFKMQLAISGLTTTVEAWIATQDPLVQIAYAESGSFKRDEPMMAAGFAAMEFTPEQIDEFFREAAAL